MYGLAGRFKEPEFSADIALVANISRKILITLRLQSWHLLPTAVHTTRPYGSAFWRQPLWFS
jgi:hypothetical protein